MNGADSTMLETGDEYLWDTAKVGPAPPDYVMIPPAERTVAALWDRAMRHDPGRPFVSFEAGPYLTYAEIDAQAQRWARGLLAAGLRPGARLAVMLPNSIDHVALFLGALRASLVVVPVNLAHFGEMLRHILVDSEAELLVGGPSVAELIDPGWELPALRTLVVTGDRPVRSPGRETLLVQELLDRAPDESTVVAPTPRDVAAVLYTSGTTGPSKGAVVSHEYYVHYAWAFARTMAFTDEDVLFTALPMFHVNAQVCTLLPGVLTGARVVVYERFSASRFWHQLADSGATHFAGMGAMGNILMKRPPAEYRDDHRLRLCQMVPAPDDLAAFESRFRVPVTYAMYGMTEGMLVPPSRDGTHRPGLIGRHHPYHQVAIVDEHDDEVPPGVVGELVVRPLLPGIMFREYLGRPEETLRAFRNLWFHTGDLGMRDENGELWYRGRKKDAIRRRGENVSAYEVEREVLRHESVAEAAVVGVAAELGEEEVLVVVAPQPGRRIDPAELYEFCRDRLPAFMVPRYIEIRPELPKNDSQRVLKHLLRADGLRPGVWQAPTPDTARHEGNVR